MKCQINILKSFAKLNFLSGISHYRENLETAMRIETVRHNLTTLISPEKELSFWVDTKSEAEQQRTLNSSFIITKYKEEIRKQEMLKTLKKIL